MTEDKNKHLVCSAEHAGALDTPWRRLGNNPKKILAPFIKEGMQVMDFGCGPGFFTLEMGKSVGKQGKVYAVDLQKEMLEKVDRKIKHAKLNIKTHQCESESIALDEQFDFILAFYVIHEVPNPVALFAELKQALKPGGKMLIAEPWFHVKRRAFETMKSHLLNAGFKIIDKPGYFFSRAIVISHA